MLHILVYKAMWIAINIHWSGETSQFRNIAAKPCQESWR